jgi:uncharacterized protein (TIGR02391 family)
MTTLQEVIPDVEAMLAFSPEELGWPLLLVAKSQLQNGIVARNNLRLFGDGMAADRNSSYRAKEKEVGLAVAEAWNWLCVQGLLVPAPGINGTNGFCVISRRGREIVDFGAFERFREAHKFPKSMIHPSIADKVWLDLVRGDLADAVFTSFRAVEEAVRRAGKFRSSDIGTPLMRAAFDSKDGPLTDQSQEKAEREALAHLFAGAIGSYKNPHSHRTISITDAKEAQEMVVLASHLLRIVDSRSVVNAPDSALDAAS